MQNDETHKLHTLRLKFNSGQPGVQVQPDHPLAAPFRRAMLEGAPAGVLTTIVLMPETESPLLFGTLVMTEASRLLFCPAFDFAVIADPKDPDDLANPIEHVTLDFPRRPGRYNSHVAYLNGLRAEGHTTWPPDGFLVPWFSLLFPTEEMVPLLPEIIDMSFMSPRSDDEYPAHLMGRQQIAVLDLPPRPEGPSFVQVDVWAGMTDDWTKRKFDVVPWVFTPGVAESPPDPNDIQASQVSVTLAGDRGVRIVFARPQGTLSSPRLMRVGRWNS